MFKVLTILNEYSHLGEQILDDGTHLIGHATHIAPNAWLHGIFPPLDLKQIDELENNLGSAIPKDYKSFLLVTNGLKVFNTTLTLDGLRSNYRRNVSHNWQPFDILTPNLIERPVNATENLFFIGGYDWDGSILYIDKETNKVHLCANDDSTSLYEWESFKKMLNSEIKRLIGLFDTAGVEYNENESTLPI